ncbi:hypothetical protein KNT87_gp291 [Erwinia phage Cronus]|uniref:Uncharacterized protein n=1 Tax=Erwinia phage Cronus TaxID=2163633 RepID=A0A2S1GMH0_9CAUD|nr:hypothetical protein KNT87_gp291 [Erwinia phage Cronus]AWD90569.1 hypothetical protein [Erwinia phage Cronus]
MQYQAKIKVRKQEYMDDDYKTEEKFVSVEAESEEQAEDKIYNYYKGQSRAYDVTYDVWSIDFFLVID